jgi:hypothetical protein
VVVVVGKDFLTCLHKPPFKSDLISALFSPHHRWSSLSCLLLLFFKEKKEKHFVQGRKRSEPREEIEYVNERKKE